MNWEVAQYSGPSTNADPRAFLRWPDEHLEQAQLGAVQARTEKVDRVLGRGLGGRRLAVDAGDRHGQRSPVLRGEDHVGPGGSRCASLAAWMAQDRVAERR